MSIVHQRFSKLPCFVGDVVVKQETDRWWRIQEEILYCHTQEIMFLIPKDFITDFASIPKVLWSLFSPVDPLYSKAAILHDRLYETHETTRQEADALFYEAMMATGCDLIVRYTLWSAVRLFGGLAWSNNKSNHEYRIVAYKRIQGQ